MSTAIADGTIAGPPLAWTALALGLGGIAWFAFPRDHWPRGHARWIVRANLAFTLPALVGLALLGRIDALWHLPPEFAPLAVRLPRFHADDLLMSVALGVPVGLALVWGRIRWLRRRGKPLPNSIVAPAPLAARSSADLIPASVTALMAGITEELAFRLFLPLAATRVTGDAWVGFGAATILFLMLHRYQRWPGRIAVLAASIALTALYLATGALWLAMAFHAAVDVVALAVRPWLAGFRR